jgi:hypothetical protein
MAHFFKTLEDFQATLEDEEPPSGLEPLLEALWWDARGDFDRAHAIVQDLSGSGAARLHAYLHRKEGDLPNARYWYQLAGVGAVTGPINAEWAHMVSALLAAANDHRELAQP